MPTYSLRWFPLAGFALVGLASLTGCTTNIATGHSQLNALSREDEIAIGEEALPQLTEEYGGAITDPSLNSYITGIAMSMVNHTEGDYRTLPWKFTLLNSDVINAFALPGGKVFLSRALAEKFTSEAQIAGVLGHEIGHVTAEHADRSIQNQLPTTILAGIGSVFAGDDAATQAAVGVIVSASGTYMLTYSRDQENEADMLGMRYMTLAGYHPKGMLEVMKVLAEASKGKTPPEWQSTHPNPESRIAIIQKRLDGDAYTKKIAELNLQTYDARFKSEFLDRIRTIPPPKPTKQGMIDLDHPEMWCAHCAAKRALATAAALRTGEGM